MSTIPTSAFAGQLQQLDHAEFCSFVAELWALAGWETQVDRPVVTVSKNGVERRLLVLPPGRLARLRADLGTGEFDRVVSPHVGTASPRGAPDVPVVDAEDLRHRLVYGTESDAAEALCASSLGVELRDAAWESSGRAWTPTQLALGGFALVLVVAALGVFVFGLPFFGAETEPVATDTVELTDGAEAEIDVGPPGVATDRHGGLAVGETLYVSSTNGTVAAVDVETGGTVWSNDVAANAGPPLVSNGVVYVRTNAGVHALNAVTGEPTWTYTDLFWSGTARPTVVDGVLYVSDGASLVALDAETGEDRWQADLAGVVTGPPTVHADTAYVGGPDAVVYALDAETGELEWTVEEGLENFEAMPTVAPGVGSSEGAGTNASLIVSGSRTLYAFDLNGERGWEFSPPTTGLLSGPVVVPDDGIFGPGGTENATADAGGDGTETLGDLPPEGGSGLYVTDGLGFIYEVDPATGERGWTYQNPRVLLDALVAGEGGANESAHSVYATGNEFVGTGHEFIVALNSSTGDERWRYERNVSISPPTVAGGTVYAGTENGTLLALDAEDGTEDWEVETLDAGVAGPPTVAVGVGGDSTDSHVRVGIEGHHDWLYDRRDPGPDDGVSVVDVQGPERVATGEGIDVTVTLGNAGDAVETTSVRFDADWDSGADSLSAETEIEPGEALSVTFSLPAPAEVGEYSPEMHVDDDRFELPIRALERPTFEVEDLDDPGEVWQDDEGEVIASITNTGEVAATTPVALEFNGEVVDTTEETVAGNDTVSVTFALSPDGAPAGEYNYSVATADDVGTAPLEVLAVDHRRDAIPVVTQVFGLTLLISGLGIGWWVFNGGDVSLTRRDNLR